MLKIFFLLLCCLVSMPLVYACSTCQVGDPTLTLMGAEKPYKNRLRLSVNGLTRSEELGREGFNKKTIDEKRLSFNLAYAPNTRWMFGLTVPYVNRHLETFNLSDQEVTALGDVTISVKNFLQDKEFMQKHMFGLLAGIKLSTGSEQTDENGLPLDFDVQAGQGATVINAGGWYAHFNFPYMFYTSASYFKANEGFQNFQAGDAIVFNASAQYAKSTSLSFNFALEGRWSQKDTFSGIDDEDSGGAIVFVAPSFIYTLKQDLLLNAVIKLPVIDALNGNHDESTIFTIGVTYDFDMH